MTSLPPGWRETHGVVAMEVQALGESGASVLRLRRQCAEDLFLKSEPVAALAELPGEVSRLRWMAGQGMPAPRVVDAVTEQGRHWLLMTAVPGQSLAESAKRTPAATVALMAEALRQLHQRPAGECPFDHALAARVRLAQARMTAGLVDEADFDEEQLGRTASDVFADLLAARPAKEDRVVTHGDACLPNLMAEGARFSGFIDCGRLGVADRWQDLALATRDIAADLGDEWVAPFLASYGVEADPARIRFYRLLDEFF
ncbi:aminoglycoside 3'-phosphotransferase [Pseudomonas sp. 39004]|uniref:APH(3') family aminoglycoside O-phosphotransferase n=1 Tax=Pseudomonas sp. 39004 TaxID=2967213 RepID=UPI0023647B27|nr:APH(3') family aminoglycoside O-phosphotransferase [Pseudomonas sp. 39004]MDD1959794.1 aminoglycoside 3'-phosphotransferase [Pseudomonas sp. 39004]